MSLIYCPVCGTKLVIPKKTDAYLMKFLGIDKKILKRFKEIRDNTIIEAKNLAEKGKKITAIGISGSSRDRFDMAGEESSSEFLLNECLKEIKKLGAETELIQLRKHEIKPCKSCYSTTNAQCHFYCSCYPKGTKLGDDMTNIIYDKILKADIIIFATPVNNFKISSLMALFLDRCISLDGSLEPADPKATKNKDLNIKHTKFIELMSDQKIPGSGFLRRFMGKVAGVIVTGHEEGASMAISDLFMTLNHFGMVFPPWSNMYAMSSILNGTYKDKNMVTNPAYIEEAQQIGRNAISTAKLLRNFNKLDWEHDYSSN
jgi:multimeric flavodoxin WrbA